MCACFCHSSRWILQHPTIHQPVYLITLAVTSYTKLQCYPAYKDSLLQQDINMELTTGATPHNQLTIISFHCLLKTEIIHNRTYTLTHHSSNLILLTVPWNYTIFVTILSLTTLWGSVLTHVRWRGLFLNHVVKQSSLKLHAKFYLNWWETFKLAYFFWTTGYIS